MVCRALPEPREREENLSKDRYSQIKADKKKKYVPASDYFTGFDPKEAVNESALRVETVQTLHNTIDREANTVLDGGLYSTMEIWSGIIDRNSFKSLWDIYVLSSLEKERIIQLVDWAFENGYGADSSVGKGKIIRKSGPVPAAPKKGGNTYMALGPFVVTDGSGISDLRADIFVRSGKVGGAFASALSPYKKPVVLFDAGAVFSCDKALECVGRLLTEMHGEDKRICQSGFAPVIPVG
jgi:CRISPR-associated protein Csm4